MIIACSSSVDHALLKGVKQLQHDVTVVMLKLNYLVWYLFIQMTNLILWVKFD